MSNFTRRRLLSLAVALPSLGCGSLMPAGLVGPAPGSLKSNAKVYAFQTASFSYSFMMGHAFSWPRLLDPLMTDGIALLEALKAAGRSLAMELVFDDPNDSASLQVNFAFPKKGDPPPQSPYPPVALVEGVDGVVLHKGRIALYSVCAMMSQLNVSNDALQRHAFALLVIREKVKNGEKAGWFEPNRPQAETLADLNLALQIIADHHEQIQDWRARVLLMVALIHAFDRPGGIETLKAEVQKAHTDSERWLATHKQPTSDDFGVAMNELPTPESLIKNLDANLGIVGAVLQTAKGVVTGSPQETLDGLSKLAPKDSTVAVALNGLAAASKGDISGTIDAVAKLTGNEEQVNAFKRKLAPFQDLAKKAKGI
ncbi:MAG TPA: hypothetical protein VGI10_13640 [Polyangiaceae bacterium]|jgi:hypothetical protein